MMRDNGGNKSFPISNYAKPLLRTCQVKKAWFLIFILIFLYVALMGKQQSIIDQIREPKEYSEPRTYDGNWRNLTEEEKSKLSVLGRILYLEEKRPPQKDTNYTVLFWKYGNYIKDRHLKHYTKEALDPLEGCSVKNCQFTFEDKDLQNADLVVFLLHRTKGLQDLPKTHENPDQIWTFLTDESPYHTFLSKVNRSDFNGKFNWSMSYKMDSDIPVPYGRARKYSKKTSTASKDFSFNSSSKRRDTLVTVLGSNCGGKNHRWQYVKELKKSIAVDVYGSCGNKTACPGHFKSDCPAIDNYLFYLSFENSNCKEYITEKVFWNAYHKNSIPIIMGYKKEGYEKLLPPGSYIHVDDFADPQSLANYIIFLNETGDYNNYFKWKDSFEIVNEHGYFKSKPYHFCRICEALNFNQIEMKVYDKFDEFVSTSNECK